MKIIMYETADGRLHIRGKRTAHFVNRFSGETFEEQDDAAAQHIIDNLMPADAINIVAADDPTFPSSKVFRNAWRKAGAVVSVDMPVAREIHAERIAAAQIAEIALLKVEERKERLKGNTAQADAHAATVTVLDALDLNVLATRIANAANPMTLTAIWPANVPK